MNATKDDIHDAGVKLVLTMYERDINHYFPAHCRVDAVELHSERAYHQIQDCQSNSLDPDLFGCKMVDELLETFPMNKEPVPPFLMEVTTCKCTKGCRSWIY